MTKSSTFYDPTLDEELADTAKVSQDPVSDDEKKKPADPDKKKSSRARRRSSSGSSGGNPPPPKPEAPKKVSNLSTKLSVPVPKISNRSSSDLSLNDKAIDLSDESVPGGRVGGIKFSRRSDVFLQTIPISDDMKAKHLSIKPVDWSDSFASDLHLLLDADHKAYWNEFVPLFNSVSDSDGFRQFISGSTDSLPLAFLGFDPKGNLRVFHNVIQAPRTSVDSFFRKSPSKFLCLTKKPFDSPPNMLDPQELDTLLPSFEIDDVPLGAHIIDFCVVDVNVPQGESSRPAHLPPDFRFDSAKLKALVQPTTISSEDEAFFEEFSTKKFAMLHPSFAGVLLNFFDSKSKELDKSLTSPEAVAAELFSFVIHRWYLSLSDDDLSKIKSCPTDSELIVGLFPILQFLWCASHVSHLLEPISFEVPDDFGLAVSAFKNHLFKFFPDAIVEPFSLLAPSNGLPPLSSSLPKNPPSLNPPPSFASAAPPSVPHVGGVSADTIYLTEKMSENFSEALARHSTKLTKDRDDEKKEIFKNASHLRNGIVFGQVGPSSLELPSAPSETAADLFKQKSTHTLYSSIQAKIFRKSDNAGYILFSQCGILQKYGVRWRAEDLPSGFSPFSFDPYNCAGPDSHMALDHDIHRDIYECSLRHDNGLSTKDMRDIFTNEKLFCPLTCDEFLMQLRSYYLFASAIWGKECFISIQVHKMIEHHLRHRHVYRNSQSYDHSFLSRVLFSIDNAVQRFIEDNLEMADCLEDISGSSLTYHMDKLCDKIDSREDICRELPRFVDSTLRTKLKKQNPSNSSSPSRGNGSSNSSNNSRKRPADRDANDGQAIPWTRFDSPPEWCLPTNLKYSKVFPRSVLDKIPKFSSNGVVKPFCNKLFSMKSCRNGTNCYFSHEDPRNHGKGEAMTSFYKKAYADASRNE